MKRILIAECVGVSCLVAMVALGLSVRPAGASGSESDKGEKLVALEDLPSAVRAAAQKVTGGGTLKHIDLERKDGRDAYSVEASMAGKNKEFTFAADGTLLAEEEDVAFAELPKAGRTAAEKYFGGSSGLHASKEIAGGVTSYEVEGKKGGKEISLKLNASGAVVEEEAEDDEDGD